MSSSKAATATASYSAPAVLIALLLVCLVWGSTYLCIRIAPIAWAAGSAWSRGGDLPLSFLAAAAQMLCSGMMIVLAGALRGERMGAWLALGCLALFGAVITFTAHGWLLHAVRPALAACVNPLIAVALVGAWRVDERFTAHGLGALAVILAGVVVINLARVRAR